MSNTDQNIDDVVARLVALRTYAGFSTQRDFAWATGMSQPEYAHFESGRRLLTLSAANKIKRKWHVTLDWLYHGDTSGLPVSLARALSGDKDYSIL